MEQIRSAPIPDAYTLPFQEVASRLGANLEQGLSAAQVAEKLTQFGPNEIPDAQTRSPWKILGAQFADFMILVLLAAAVLAGMLGEPEDAVAISAIVVLNAVIGFTQEYRAERAMALLRKLSSHQARVRRNAEVISVPASELVPGDLVLLEAGNAIPADIRVVQVAQLKVDESALTGESQSVEKSVEPSPPGGDHVSLAERTSMAFKGTTITHGRGTGIVVATGMQTELGKIATLISQSHEVKTPLQKRLAAFGRSLAFAALAICAIVFASGLIRGEPWLRMLLTSISLAVAAIPEALPAVATIALALGARRMLRVNALARRLPAVETLGSVTYICSDKTGTLTVNRMKVAETLLADEANRHLLFTALAVSNDADGAAGDPTEIALLEAAASEGFEKSKLQADWPRLREIPFSAERRRMTTVHLESGLYRSFTKGAPEDVLPLCENNAPRWQQEADRMAEGGLRVLAFATRTVPALGDDVEENLTFLGLAGSMDPPRPEAREAVALCRKAGIVPVMITGDHPRTAAAIARQLGLIDEGGEVLSGADIAGLSPTDLQDAARRVRVYARVDPAQKVALVEALQRNGEFVAMTGDGVNDAAALKRADIGVAMGKGGTDVAREASSLVLLDDNFATIVAAVREGRHIFDNIRKFVRFVLASNSGEIWTIFLAPFLGLPVPLLPIHILWINLVTDGLPGLALAIEPAEPGIMERPPRPPSESLFAHGLWQHVIWVGLLIGGISLLSEKLLTGTAQWQTMVFMVLTLSQLAHVMAVRSESASLWSLGLWSNPQLLGAVALTIGLQLMVVYWEPMQPIFKTVPLSMEQLGVAAALSFSVFLAVEVEKWMMRRRWIYQ